LAKEAVARAEPEGTLGRAPRAPDPTERLEILLRQLHEKVVTTGPTPAIAFDAADEPLAVVLDLDKRALSAVAVLRHGRGSRLSSDSILHTLLDERVSVLSRNVLVYRAPFASDHHKVFAIGHEAFEFFTTKLIGRRLSPTGVLCRRRGDPKANEHEC